MKQSVIAFLAGAIITGAVFYFVCCQKGGIASSGPNSNPSNTILKSKGYVVIKTDTTHPIAGKAFTDIEPVDAQKMIKAYLATSTASTPLFIDFDFNEIYGYLDYISRTETTDNFGVRLYFGTHTAETSDPTHPVGSLALILVATKNNIDFYPGQIKPIDYGNLCPPSTNCVDTANKGQLIYKAKRLP